MFWNQLGLTPEELCSESFWDATDLEDFSGIYLKVTINIYVIFEGSLEDLLSDPLDFVVSFYPGWGCTFVVFFWPGHGKRSDWGWAEQVYSYKIWTQQSPPNINPDIYTVHDPNFLWETENRREILKGPALIKPCVCRPQRTSPWSVGHTVVMRRSQDDGKMFRCLSSCGRIQPNINMVWFAAVNLHRAICNRVSLTRVGMYIMGMTDCIRLLWI